MSRWVKLWFIPLFQMPEPMVPTPAPAPPVAPTPAPTADEIAAAVVAAQQAATPPPPPPAPKPDPYAEEMRMLNEEAQQLTMRLSAALTRQRNERMKKRAEEAEAGP